ncbi:MAG: hypothetical protein WCE38_16950 [Burkholderiales bacterium]
MNVVRGVSPPSGEQHENRHGAHRAVVTEEGATLRHYSVGDVDVIDGFDEREWAPSVRGQVLAPWPNRLDGGRYTFEGKDGKAALNEPTLQNAIHGLVRWLPWKTSSKSIDEVTLACVLHPQPGYPWQLDLQVGYRLDGRGLTVSMLARNASDVPAPFGIGFHPYLTVPASRVSCGKPMVSARAVLATPDGGWRVTVWVDASFTNFMIYTGDTVGDTLRRRCAVAIEPMTCPPNAFRSGTDLLRIAPDAFVEGRWGLAPELSGNLLRE